MPMTQDKRAYAGGKYSLELDGFGAGLVASAEGGYAMADVVEQKLGPDHAVHKHLAGVKYEDITINCGTGMSKAFYDLISATVDGKYQRKNGAVVASDYSYKEQSRLSFYNALISEVGFPALDASSKDAARLTVKFNPEYTRSAKGSGKEVPAAYGAKSQARWSPANFRLKIDGLDCTKVSGIEPIVVKNVIVETAVGELRQYEKEPSHVEVPDLVVTLVENSAKSFYDWHEDFLVKGNNGEDKEKSGTLEFLTPNTQKVLFTLAFSGLGIYKLAPEEGDSEKIAKVTVSMYCQGMQFSAASDVQTAATAPTAPASAPAPAETSSEPAPAATEAALPVATEAGQAILSGDYPSRFTRVRVTA